jgi:hypothetical protein
LPNSEFTFADAAKASPLGDYATIHVGKWHLGDLWDKKLPGMNRQWPVSSPGTAGFDEWMTTEAEVSSSKPNCGCYPVNHTGPIEKAPVTACSGAQKWPNGTLKRGPSGGTSGCDLQPHGDQCVVNGGYLSNWNFPCTDYYYPNASDERGVSGMADWKDPAKKIAGDDTLHIADRFTDFLDARVKDGRPWLAHLCIHSIHEPHPAMPEYGARLRQKVVHSRMPLVPTPARLKLLHACGQCHSARMFTPLTGWHGKFRPNTEGTTISTRTTLTTWGS